MPELEPLRLVITLEVVGVVPDGLGDAEISALVDNLEAELYAAACDRLSAVTVHQLWELDRG